MNSRTGDLGSNPPSSWIFPLPHRLPSSWPAFPSSQSSHPVGMSVTTCHIQAGGQGWSVWRNEDEPSKYWIGKHFVRVFLQPLMEEPKWIFGQVNIIIPLLGTDSQLYSPAHSTPAWEMVVAAPNSWPSPLLCCQPGPGYALRGALW